MPHVITQSCCNDASCVFACPVNCIHPTPDEPGFATSEMLYIDPVACVDCGACVTACPVSAIAPNTRLDFEQPQVTQPGQHEGSAADMLDRSRGQLYRLYLASR